MGTREEEIFLFVWCDLQWWNVTGLAPSLLFGYFPLQSHWGVWVEEIHNSAHEERVLTVVVRSFTESPLPG